MIINKQKTPLELRKIVMGALISLSIFVIAPNYSLMAYAASNNMVLADDYPERYTVVKGDNLWDISAKFLRDPWRWPEVWQGNPQVNNPDLIYPGDVLIMSIIDGRPVLRSLRRETVKLSPSAKVVDFADAIQAIDPAAIQAYINAPLVTDEDELKKAAYVVEGMQKHLLMGKYDQFYARGIKDQQAEQYRLFRPGRHFIDPISKESLGWEAEHVGDANMLRAGDPSRLSLLDTYKDVSIGDRIRPSDKNETLPFFYPKAPDNRDLRGYILDTKNKSTELGALSVVAISVGERENVKQGDVFRILSQALPRRDPVTGEKYTLPEEKVGLLVVFRTFEKVSYALVTNSSRSLRANDVVVSPDYELPVAGEQE